MSYLYFDEETRSSLNLKTVGSYKYAERVEILLFAWALDEGPINVWDCTESATPPADLLQHWNDPTVIKVGHNCGTFDRVMVNATRLLPPLPVDRYIDTMVWAMAHSLPGGLGQLGPILGLTEGDMKDADGRKYIRMFCVPSYRKDGSMWFKDRHSHPVEWKAFIEYARGDIRAMREIVKRLPKVNYPTHRGEYNLWILDQAMNDRGIPIDRRLAFCAVREANRIKTELGAKVYELTDGEVESATQRDAMLRYLLDAFGVGLPDMQASTLEARLNDETLPDEVKELIAIRLEATTTSVSKYTRLINATGADGRLRGCVQFCGALRTSRDAGRLFQPQNLPRPTMKAAEIEVAIGHLYNGELIENYPDRPMKVLSNALRGAIVAPPGRKLCVADLSNIEGRAQSWAAGETWKIKAFYDFDTIIGYDIDINGKKIAIRKGKDLYILAYARAFNCSPMDVDEYKRQVGKVMELALGYGGGVAAFITFARLYRLDLQELADRAYTSLPEFAINRAKSNYAWTTANKRPTHGLSEYVWIACEALKVAWREAHPMIVGLWAALEQAAKSAISMPGMVFHAGDHVQFATSASGQWLYMKVPSGTCLCYPKPQVDDDGQITYMGMNQYSRKWQRLKTYGGKLFENFCQKHARDVLFYNKFEIEAAGYHIVLPVHDEFITETPDSDEFSAAELARLMSLNKPWSQGMPLAAAGFECYRYRKG